MKFRVHQGTVLSPLLFPIVIYVVMNEINYGTLQEVLYADDLVLMAETEHGGTAE